MHINLKQIGISIIILSILLSFTPIFKKVELLLGILLIIIGEIMLIQIFRHKSM
jgi:hypothetical protein